MALDIYAGSFTRYYCLAWENVAEQQAKLEGYSYTQISPDGPVDKSQAPSPNDVEHAILAWRDAVTKGLGKNLDAPLEWVEGVDSPYSTDRPGYPGYSGLMLWAAYAGRKDTAVPENLPPGGWYEDAVFQRSIEKDAGTPYRQILLPEIWLPADFAFVFEVPSPVHEPTWVGSSIELVRQLDSLNRSTFAARGEEVEKWFREDIDSKSEVEHAAKFTFAVFHRLANFAVQNRVPLLLSC